MMIIIIILIIDQSNPTTNPMLDQTNVEYDEDDEEFSDEEGMDIFIYTHIDICMHIYVFMSQIYMHICMHIYVFMSQIYMHKCMHIYMYINKCVYPCICKYVYMYVGEGEDVNPASTASRFQRIGLGLSIYIYTYI
jgi:hypothetical protein